MTHLQIQLLVGLVGAHVLGDFIFQSSRVAREKRRMSVLVQHALLHSLLAYLLCGAWSTWQIPVAVLLAHAVIDAVKARVASETVWVFLLDQAAHVASLFAIAVLTARTGPVLFWIELWGASYSSWLILASGAIVTIFAGGVAIGLAVKPLRQKMEGSEGRGFEDGGRIIGQLERALIFFFVLTGQMGSIGFLIAAKSVFRFGELKEHDNRMEAEYILIGTMMSFGFALLAAYLTRRLLGFSA